MKKVGYVDPLVFRSWCDSQSHLLKPDTYKSSQRREIAEFGFSANPYKPFNYRWTNYSSWMSDFCSRYQPDWEMALLLRYSKNGLIKSHRDATPFGRCAHSLSDVDFDFKHGRDLHRCKAGLVYQFDCKIMHSVPPVQSDRYCLVWWPANSKVFDYPEF